MLFGGELQFFVAEALVLRLMAQNAAFPLLHRRRLGKCLNEVLIVGRFVAGLAVARAELSSAAKDLEGVRVVLGVALATVEACMSPHEWQPFGVVVCVQEAPVLLSMAGRAGDLHATFVIVFVASHAVPLQAQVALPSHGQDCESAVHVALAAVLLQVLAGHVEADQSMVEFFEIWNAGSRETVGVDERKALAVVFAMTQGTESRLVLVDQAVQTEVLVALDYLGFDVFMAFETGLVHVLEPTTVAAGAVARATEVFFAFMNIRECAWRLPAQVAQSHDEDC